MHLGISANLSKFNLAIISLRNFSKVVHHNSHNEHRYSEFVNEFLNKKIDVSIDDKNLISQTTVPLFEIIKHFQSAASSILIKDHHHAQSNSVYIHAINLHGNGKTIVGINELELMNSFRPCPITVDDIFVKNFCESETKCHESIINRENQQVTFLKPPFLLNNIVDMCKVHLESEKRVLKEDSIEKPTEEQLHNIYLKLSKTLPGFFVQPHDYSVYHKNISFEDNIRGIITRGIGAYVRELAWIRIIAHLRFAHVRLEILKITSHPEDGTIRIRWRIKGISGLKVFFMFWKFKMWDLKSIDKEAKWYDGFSTFWVHNDGFVHRHRCDKVMPDDSKIVTNPGGLAVKLGAFGFVPKMSLEILYIILSLLIKYHNRVYPLNQQNDCLMES